MSDVEIFRRVNGFKFEKAIAILGVVQRELGLEAEVLAGNARARLAKHRSLDDRYGHSEINVTQGKRVDWFVNLDDTKSQRAAAAIEFGRNSSTFPRATIRGEQSLRIRKRSRSRGVGALTLAMMFGSLGRGDS